MIITNMSQTRFDYTLPDGTVVTETRDSNIVNTEILTYSFTKVKSTDRTFLQEGEIATQTVVLTNTSLINLTNIVFRDTLSAGASYVSGSVVVDGIPQPSFDLVSGFAINDLAPNGSSVVSYKIQADNPLTVSPVTNYATVNYTALERPLSDNSNTVTIPIISNRLTINKQVDKPVAEKGEILTYLSTITNTGSLPKSNLLFTDVIPVGSTFVTDSVKINGVQMPGFNPQTGFSLPNLAVGESVTVEFMVTVN